MSELTKRALEQSLKNLLLQKPLNKITISDIADDCGITVSKVIVKWFSGKEMALAMGIQVALARMSP